MSPLIGIAFVAIVFNLWMQKKIIRKQRQEQNQPRWNEKIDRDEYDNQVEKLKLKHMREEPEEIEDES